MTPDQYRDAIKRLGLGQNDAAQWLGIAVRTSQYYASGGTKIPEPVAILLRFCIKLKLQKGNLPQ